MKNRKNIFTLAIITLILVLGVGYAVVSQVTLTINGTGASKTENLKVVYNGNNSGTNDNVTAISSPDDTIAATFTVADMVLNTPVVLEYEIENKEEDVNATLSLPSITQNTKSNFFSVSFEYKDSAMSGAGTYSAWTSGTKTLAHGAVGTLKVIVTLTSTPIVEADSSTTIGISINAAPAAA